jgi:DNA-directed RNA polymerase specialized sigma24 family protein
MYFLNALKTSNPYSDPGLVTLLKQKDMVAYEFLIEKYAGALHGVVRQIVPGEEHASSVLKESFLNISTYIQQYDSTKCRLFTWMLQTTRETALKKLKELNLSVAAEDEKKETVIGKMSEKLDKEQQELIQLSYFKGFTTGDLASRLNISEDTVKTKLKLALSHLNTLL